MGQRIMGEVERGAHNKGRLKNQLFIFERADLIFFRFISFYIYTRNW